MYNNWQTSIEDHRLRLTLSRAEAKNSITDETLHELRDIVATIAQDDDVWQVILDANGKHFSVGVDYSILGALAGADQETFTTNLRDLQACLDAFEQLKKPKIARIHGACVGGGLILACCCDFRVAADTAVFRLPEVRLGIAVLMGTQRITRLAGPAATKEMILLGEKFDATQAHSWNLVHRVVPESALNATVDQLSTTLALSPPRTLAVANEIIDRAQTMSLTDSQALEAALQAALLGSPDWQEAIAATFGKRAPQYNGT